MWFTKKDKSIVTTTDSSGNKKSYEALVEELQQAKNKIKQLESIHTQSEERRKKNFNDRVDAQQKEFEAQAEKELQVYGRLRSIPDEIFTKQQEEVNATIKHKTQQALESAEKRYGVTLIKGEEEPIFIGHHQVVESEVKPEKDIINDLVEKEEEKVKSDTEQEQQESWTMFARF